MGVDIFSAGSIDESEPGVEVVRYEDPALGAYKKLLLKDNRLRGMILVGDIEDEAVYMDWMRSGTDLALLRRQLLFPAGERPRPRSGRHAGQQETVCGCNGVRKGRNHRMRSTNTVLRLCRPAEATVRKRIHQLRRLRKRPL